MKVRSLVLVSAALILSAASCIARQEAPADGSSNSVATALAPLLDQAKIIAGLNEVTRDAYPDAESVLVSEHARTEYLADGGFVPSRSARRASPWPTR